MNKGSQEISDADAIRVASQHVTAMRSTETPIPHDEINTRNKFIALGRRLNARDALLRNKAETLRMKQSKPKGTQLNLPFKPPQSNSSTEIIGNTLVENFKKVCWGQRYDEVKGKKAHQRVMRAKRAAKIRGIQGPWQASEKDLRRSARYARKTGEDVGPGHPDWAKVDSTVDSTKIIGNSILEALKYILETGEVKRRNKAKKRAFEGKVGKLALAHERGSEGGRVSRGPRKQLSKRKAQRGAENVAAGRAARAGQRTSGYERSPELTKRIRTAGQKAAKHTPDDDDTK